MATATGILVGTLEASEENGVASRVVQRYMVYGLTASDDSILDEAYAASGIPAAGSRLANQTNLVVVSRNFEMPENDDDKAYITIEYGRVGREDGFEISSGSYRWNAKLIGSLQQIQTQNDVNGAQVTVSHTFGASDPDYPSETEVRGGFLNVTEPQMGIEITGIVAVDYPQLVVLDWVNKVNSDTWVGLAPGVWLCQSVEFTMNDQTASPRLWDFRFEFQAKRDGWQPTVIYIDERYGVPPPDLVANTGYKQVDWYLSRPFNELFPV